MLRTAVGDAVRYKAGPVELPASQRVKMREDAIFDLASLTKVYTAILVLQLVDRGKVELDAPVRRYLPDFTGAGKEAVTVAMLLAHTSALPVGAKVTGMSSNTARWAAVMSTPLVKGGKPGTTFRYSSVGLMVLGRLVEKLTGKSLDKAVRDLITTPMGLTDTGFTPLKWAQKDRLVATDARTSRGLLRGTVHDDVCNILGGVAGHAGLFGTAKEVAAIGQMLLRRRHLQRPAHPVRRGGQEGPDQRQQGQARHRRRASRPLGRPRPGRGDEPAVVHGQAGRAHVVRPHRLHRHLTAGGPRPRDGRGPADQPGPPQLDLVQPGHPPSRPGQHHRRRP